MFLPTKKNGRDKFLCFCYLECIYLPAILARCQYSGMRRRYWVTSSTVHYYLSHCFRTGNSEGYPFVDQRWTSDIAILYWESENNHKIEWIGKLSMHMRVNRSRFKWLIRKREYQLSSRLSDCLSTSFCIWKSCWSSYRLWHSTKIVSIIGDVLKLVFQRRELNCVLSRRLFIYRFSSHIISFQLLVSFACFFCFYFLIACDWVRANECAMQLLPLTTFVYFNIIWPFSCCRDPLFGRFVSMAAVIFVVIVVAVVVVVLASVDFWCDFFPNNLRKIFVFIYFRPPRRHINY